jgi:hypothetical protein
VQQSAPVEAVTDAPATPTASPFDVFLTTGAPITDFPTESPTDSPVEELVRRMCQRLSSG